MELGGVPRILYFIQGNKGNIGFMLRASKVINTFLYPGTNDKHLENASTMAQQFVEREGVEMMLSIIKEKCTGELDIDQLNTLRNIFCIFIHTICNLNAKNMVDIDNFSPIVDAGISTLAILRNISTHDVAVAHVKRAIFIYFRNFVEFNAEMIDVVEFHEKNIFSKCVRGLKNPVDNTWKYDKDVWEEVSKFFLDCCYGNRKILSRDGDFEVIVPFCIQFMKVNRDCAYTMCVFDVLRKASDIIGKKKMITNNKGLLIVLGGVADCCTFDSNSVKDAAINLMKYLFDEL